MEAWSQDAGYFYWGDENDIEKGKVVEERFGLKVFHMLSTLGQIAWENGENVWLIYDVKVSHAPEWTEEIIDYIHSSMKNSVSKTLERDSSIDDTYSIGFFTAEDTENQEICLVVILQCIAKSNTAAPVA